MVDILLDHRVTMDVVAAARKIAIYNKYPHLKNGLQPVEDCEIDGKVFKGLESKLFDEWDEFKEALRTKDRAHQRHEAADIYYYAACLEEQTREHILPSQMASLRVYGFDTLEVEIAARIKYGWRSEKAGNKDEAHEIALIEAAWKAR